MRDLQNQGITTCLNPKCQTGRLYILTSERDKHILSLPEIELQTQLLRAKTRIAVFKEIGRDHSFDTKQLTATQIRKNLRDNSDYSIGLNHVLAATKFLMNHQLIQVVDYTLKRDLKIFGISELGKRILSKIAVPMDEIPQT